MGSSSGSETLTLLQHTMSSDQFRQQFLENQRLAALFVSTWTEIHVPESESIFEIGAPRPLCESRKKWIDAICPLTEAPGYDRACWARVQERPDIVVICTSRCPSHNPLWPSSDTLQVGKIANPLKLSESRPSMLSIGADCRLLVSRKKRRLNAPTAFFLPSTERSLWPRCKFYFRIR